MVLSWLLFSSIGIVIARYQKKMLKEKEVFGAKIWFQVNNIATDKALFSSEKMLISFLFLHENICCGYSLEAPRRGASNEYHNVCFHGEIRKILCGYPLLSVAMK